MNSVPSKLEKNNIDELYRKNQVKSISFLVILSGVLLLTILLSLRAGSYETPIGELIKGIFGMSADRKINIVVQITVCPVLLPRSLPVAAWALPVVSCRRCCEIHWLRPLPWAYRKARPLVLPLPS